ncbi:hypothetical protein SAMN05518856_108280 [Paenibacillus sp. OK003]|nr:hypothetical protein SAMN05518856_108280 [Paenibacillus sp. OK003]
MVIVMMTFNLWHNGLLSKMSALEILLQFVLCFTIAFLVESYNLNNVSSDLEHLKVFPGQSSTALR